MIRLARQLSLRARLLLVTSGALLLCVIGASGLAAWHDARSVAEELRTALASADANVRASLTQRPGDLAGVLRTIRAMDGNWSVRAELVAANGAVTAASVPRRIPPVPGWYARLMAQRPQGMVVPVPHGNGAAVRLVGVPGNEMQERWEGTRDWFAVICLVFGVAAAVNSVLIGAAVRPLTGLARGLEGLRLGGTETVLPLRGPPEVAHLGQSFNDMAAALRAADHRGNRLQNQLATLAEEERMEIARDLHDEVGPLLFAISTFTATMARTAAQAHDDGLLGQVRAVENATLQLQASVRGILERLHEQPGEQGMALGEALGGLSRFWHDVQPQTEIDVHVGVDEARLGEQARAALLRIAQEGISNAMRHGSPRRIDVRAQSDGECVTLSIKDDGRGAAVVKGGAEGGRFGLAGMRARAAAAGGTLHIRRERGWEVIARVRLNDGAVGKA